VTEECLLDPSRNPQLGKEGIEKLLKEYLGIDKVIWLWKGMAGESSKQQPVLFLNGLAGGGGGSRGPCNRLGPVSTTGYVGERRWCVHKRHIDNCCGICQPIMLLPP
jgi:hypothetical protein